MAKRHQATNNMLTIKEAADLVGLSYQSIARYVALERIPARKFGHQWVVMEQDIRNFAKQPRMVGNPEFGAGYHTRRASKKVSK